LSCAPRLLAIGVTPHEANVSAADAAVSWSILFYKHEATLQLDDDERELTPGSVVVLPPGTRYRHRDPRRSAYLTARFTLREQSSEPMPLAAVQDLGPDFSQVCQRLEHAAGVFRDRPAQAEARLWDVLWELSERTTRKELRASKRHIALDRACRVIQSRLSESLSLADLASPAGVSPAHLTRLFRAEMGVTATDYLRRCRLDRALYLLTQSDVPIKEIACEIGIPDLHAFNKAIRRGFGLAPRELRSRGAAPSQTIAPSLDEPLARASGD
jgi:AraC-like DNA-binding protein